MAGSEDVYKLADSIPKHSKVVSGFEKVKNVAENDQRVLLKID